VGWQDAGSHDGLRQRFGVCRDLKGRQAADDRKSLLHFSGIAD
jgi:hypothetical protein